MSAIERALKMNRALKNGTDMTVVDPEKSFVSNVIESCNPDPEVNLGTIVPNREPDPEADQDSQAWPNLIPIAGPEPEPARFARFPSRFCRGPRCARFRSRGRLRRAMPRVVPLAPGKQYEMSAGLT